MVIRKVKAPVGYYFMVDPVSDHHYLMKITGRRYTPQSKGAYFSALSLSVVEGSADKKLKGYQTFTEKDESGIPTEYVVESGPSVARDECKCNKNCRRRQVGSSGSSNTYGLSYEWSLPYTGDCKCKPC